MTDFTRDVHVSQGFYLIRPDPHKNYGIGACRIFFNLIGPEGAVTFQVSTDWYPQRALDHLSNFPKLEQHQPMGVDLGYHAHKPQFEGQNSMKCHLLGTCYYDGSTLNAENWIEGFICGGTDWLWPKLEEYYRCVFESGSYPDVTPVPRKHPDET